MSNIDDLLREFRADVPDPADGAAERILERARRAHAHARGAGEPLSPPPTPAPAAPRRPRRSRKLRWALVPVGVAAAVSAAIALAPQDSTHAPTLLERAEAAIVPPNRIVMFAIDVRSTTTAGGVVNPNRTIGMRQWTLAGADRAMAMRILISEGPLDKPPTDEDSTFITGRDGRIVDQRSWRPLFVKARDNYDYPDGGGRGELEIGGPVRQAPEPLTFVDRMRDAYRSGRLKPTGRTAGGDLRFTMTLTAADDDTCHRSEYVLDAKTLLPRRIETTSGSQPCSAGAAPVNREVTTISDARSLPATAANRRLLQVGDWPTTRILQWQPKGKPTPIDEAPPVPKLDEH
jgi:hypothetical protein